MPRLGLLNVASKTKDRKPTRYLYGHFTSDTQSFGGGLTNANVSVGSGLLVVIPTAGDGYAHRTLTVAAGTKYSIKVKTVVSSIGSGKLTLMVGTTAGATDLCSQLCPDNGTTYRSSFTTGGSTTTVHLGLKVENSGNMWYADDLLVETWD